MACTPDIFISYRRDDSEGWVTSLAHTLRDRFGADHVFRDIDVLAPGLPYTRAIEQCLAQCKVVLVMIGPRWLTATNKAGRRRLDDPHDLARLEISIALQREIPVVPVLVGRANMPTAEELPNDLHDLAYRHAYELSDRRWIYDQEELVRILESPGYLDRPAVPMRKRTPSEPVSGRISEHVDLHASHVTLAEIRSPATYAIIAYATYMTAGFVAFLIAASLTLGAWGLIWPPEPDRPIIVNLLSMISLSAVLYIIFVTSIRKINAKRKTINFGHLIALVSMPFIFVLTVLMNPSPEIANPKPPLGIAILLAVLISMPFLLRRATSSFSNEATAGSTS